MQNALPNLAQNEDGKPHSEPPVLIHAPLGADAEAISAEAAACGMSSHICRTAADLERALTRDGPEGALMAVVSQEGAGRESGEIIDRAFAAEPSWARLPVVFLVSDVGRPPVASQMLDRKENAPPHVLLERPIGPAVLRKVLETLAEGRRRQFETRDLLERLRREEAHRSFLLSELRHRTRNSLAVLQSLFSLSVRRAQSLEEFAAAFGARLRSLTDAHNRLAETEGTADELAALVSNHVLPYAASPEQLRAEGPSVRIHERLAFNLAMVIHELATNAAKYGALSAEEGTVDVEWWVEEDTGRLGIRWRERGGPAVAQPERTGLGRGLIEQFPAGSEHTELRFEEDGIIWTSTIEPPDWAPSKGGSPA